MDVPSTAPSGFGRYLTQVFAEYITFTECKRLVAQISLLQERRSFKVLTLTSALKGEGKTFLVLSLALGFVFIRAKKVLVVDASAQTAGRTLFMEHVLGSSGAGQLQSGTLDILSTRSAGPSNSAETSDLQIVPYVRSIGHRYDLVVVDTSALGVASRTQLDPLIVSHQSDAVLLVTSPRSAGGQILSHLRKELSHWDLNIIGTVYNRGVTA